MDLPIPFGWYAVAYSKDLNPGDVEPLNFFDQHMVLFRTEDGEAKILEAYCPHLGAHLGYGGKVEGQGITCPFHGWAFNGDGVCTSVPYAKTMPRRIQDTNCLYSYPLRECNRMIWAWYHPRRVDPIWELDEVEQFSDPNWSEFDTYELEINSHIQETGENGVDIAHFVYVHSAREMPKADVTLEDHRRTTDMVTLGPVIDEEGNIDLSTLEDSHLVSTNCGPGMTTQIFSRAFQTVMLGTIVPITANKLLLRFAFTKPVNISAQFNVFTDGLIAEIVRQVEYDIPIWENKIYREDPILCDGDGPISKYRRWFEQFYDDGEVTPIRRVS